MIWFSLIANDPIQMPRPSRTDGATRSGLLDDGVVLATAMTRTGVRLAVLGLSIWIGLKMIRFGLGVAFPSNLGNQA